MCKVKKFYKCVNGILGGWVVVYNNDRGVCFDVDYWC